MDHQQQEQQIKECFPQGIKVKDNLYCKDQAPENKRIVG